MAEIETVPGGTNVPAAPVAAPVAPVAPATTAPAPTAPVAAPVAVAPVAAPVAPAPVAPAPAAPPALPAAPADSKWLTARLEGAKRSAQTALLAELGFQSVDAAKAAAAEAKARADASLTAEQKAARAAAELAAVQSQAQQHASIIQEHAARMFGVLKPEHQTLVKSFAGDDPAQQLATIQKLTDAGLLTWDAEEQAQVTTTPAIPPPATTAPPPTAPGGTTATSPPDHKANYTTLRAQNPFKAAAYGAQHPSVYQPKTS